MTNTARPKRRRPHATAARQALRLCEADLTWRTWETPDPPGDAGSTQDRQRCIRAITTRAALRAVGVPPLAAAALRRRLRLIPEHETER
jgi:hypothetical protein